MLATLYGAKGLLLLPEGAHGGQFKKCECGCMCTSTHVYLCARSLHMSLLMCTLCIKGLLVKPATHMSGSVSESVCVRVHCVCFSSLYIS